MSCHRLLGIVSIVFLGLCHAAAADEPDIEALREQVRDLTKQAERAEQAGNAGEARELADQAKRLLERVKASEQRAGGEAKQAEKHEPEIRELQHRLENLRQKITELSDAGRQDEANKVRGEAERLSQEIRKRQAGSRLREMQHRAEQLRRDGHDKEAEEVAAAARRLQAELQGEGGQPRGDQPRHSPELERRLRHLRAAAENLIAAGFPAEAEKLIKQAQQLQHHAGEQHHAGGQHASGGQTPNLPELVNHVRQLHQRVQRLEAAVERLTRERTE